MKEISIRILNLAKLNQQRYLSVSPINYHILLNQDERYVLQYLVSIRYLEC